MIKIKKIGIAVSTFTEEKTDPKRYELIEECLNTLASTTSNIDGIEIVKYIIVDGSIPNRHSNLLDQYSKSFTIIHRQENGGVSKTKNTSIRTLLEDNIDVGILVDDDVWFGKGWVEAYCELIEKMQLHHVVWSNEKHLYPNEPEKRKACRIGSFQKNGLNLFRHIASAGIFMTFTPHIIEKVGYFKVLPGKFGAEHLHFTRRIFKAKLITQPIDLEGSYRFIRHLGYPEGVDEITSEIMTRSLSAETMKKELINHGLSRVDLDKYYPCIE